MFDNLRDDASTSFIEDDSAELFPDESPATPPVAKPKQTGRRILGMTPAQRFVIAFMLMIAVCVLGVMFLLVTGKIGLV